MTITIHTLTPTDFDTYHADLIELLRDSVAGGASVGYLAPLHLTIASEYWNGVASEVEQGAIIALAALDADNRLVGSVQLEPASKPNGLHRAEVNRLLVHSSQRRKGIATQLMHAIEDVAREHQRTLLVLDTLQGSGASFLYPRLGYQQGGVIPDFAATPDGVLHPTVYFYKMLV